MIPIHQLLSAQVKLPVTPATQEERDLFPDKMQAKNCVFYHINLTSGQSFIGMICPETQEAFFKPSNNLNIFSDLEMIQYTPKYFFNRPDLICHLTLRKDCPKEKQSLYHSFFDSKFINFLTPDEVHYKNHALGHFAKKIFPALQQIIRGKNMQLSGQKELQTILTGPTIVQQKQQERR